MLDADNELLPPAGWPRLVAALDDDPGALSSPTAMLAIHRDGRARRAALLAAVGARAAARAQPDRRARPAAPRRACSTSAATPTTPDLHGWEDYDLWCRCAATGRRGVHVPSFVARYRRGAGSMLSITDLDQATPRRGAARAPSATLRLDEGVSTLSARVRRPCPPSSTSTASARRSASRASRCTRSRSVRCTRSAAPGHDDAAGAARRLVLGRARASSSGSSGATAPASRRCSSAWPGSTASTAARSTSTAGCRTFIELGVGFNMTSRPTTTSCSTRRCSGLDPRGRQGALPGDHRVRRARRTSRTSRSRTTPAACSSGWPSR